jgi:uncharacterized protein (DUF1330 family)
MKNAYSIAATALIGGMLIGGLAVHTLHAQAKPVYVVAEIDVTNVDAYTKEYLPAARAVITKSGGKLIGASQSVTMLEGTPQKSRVAINMFDSIDKVRAYRESAEFKDARKIGEKYATFRSYVVEAVGQ